MVGSFRVGGPAGFGAPPPRAVVGPWDSADAVVHTHRQRLADLGDDLVERLLQHALRLGQPDPQREGALADLVAETGGDDDRVRPLEGAQHQLEFGRSICRKGIDCNYCWQLEDLSNILNMLKKIGKTCFEGIKIFYTQVSSFNPAMIL